MAELRREGTGKLSPPFRRLLSEEGGGARRSWSADDRDNKGDKGGTFDSVVSDASRDDWSNVSRDTSTARDFLGLVASNISNKFGRLRRSSQIPSETNSPWGMTQGSDSMDFPPSMSVSAIRPSRKRIRTLINIVGQNPARSVHRMFESTPERTLDGISVRSHSSSRKSRAREATQERGHTSPFVGYDIDRAGSGDP
eukprot:CAMPEP_0169446548 /NCGR_PEP_ID=MMETSP1042-20121227/11035_1 /TAXON_ID=464988 /ORGANISM="Hemiselmis andersenii, Strain CCMP1180" /LENGTH=196 /DNA_ID=CAMNT_0009558025 /DNA_START=1 /DNA_END=591 /DNA_ORIENTATION=+